MSKWTVSTVEWCLDNLDLRGVPKVPARDYRPSGRYPIVDQGQELISGWTDDNEGLISTQLPVVVFGDHTRRFKYIDFPFVRGADGTQLMRPKPDINPLFFYYACRAVDLPSRGYNRHFTVLKGKEIPVPAIHDQATIAEVLRKIDEALASQNDLLAWSKKAKKSAMRKLFSCGLRGEVQKETEIGPVPESWDVKSISELCDIKSGGTPRKSATEFWGGDIPWVSGKDLKAPMLNDALDHITTVGVQSGGILAPAGSVLVLVRGMGLAKDLPVSWISRPMAFNQDVKALIPLGADSGAFLRSAIYAGKERLLSRTVTSAHGTMTLSLSDVEGLKIPYSNDPDEVEEIVHILDTFDRKIDLHHKMRAVLSELFKSLLHELMAGTMQVQELDLSALTEIHDTKLSPSCSDGVNRRRTK